MAVLQQTQVNKKYILNFFQKCGTQGSKIVCDGQSVRLK